MSRLENAVTRVCAGPLGFEQAKRDGSPTASLEKQKPFVSFASFCSNSSLSLSFFVSFCEVQTELVLPCALPFGLLDFQFGMRNKKVPDHGLERFRMRSDILGIYGRYDAACVGYFGGVSAVPPHDSKNRCGDFFSVLQRRHEVRTDIFLEVSSTDRKHHERIFRLEPAPL